MKTLKQVMALTVCATVLTACESESKTVVDNTPKNVSIEFVAKVGNTEIGCESELPALGSTAVKSTLTDLRFYASNIHLIDANDKQVPVTLTTSDWQDAGAGVALLDFENAKGGCKNGTAATNLVIQGTVPAGTYTGVGFDVGVPESVNHTDYSAAKAPLNNQAMAWSWQGGRKHAKFEVNPVGGITKTNVAKPADPATNVPTFFVHLGSTDCKAGTPSLDTSTCSKSNRMAFHNHHFDVSKQRLVLDLAAVFANTDITKDTGGPAGCMSGGTDAECTPIFANFKIDLATGNAIDSGHGQAIFVAETKPAKVAATSSIEVIQ